MPGRRIALADTDCSLAGLRVVLEILLAAQRAREMASWSSTLARA